MDSINKDVLGEIFLYSITTFEKLGHHYCCVLQRPKYLCSILLVSKSWNRLAKFYVHQWLSEGKIDFEFFACLYDYYDTRETLKDLDDQYKFFKTYGDTWKTAEITPGGNEASWQIYKIIKFLNWSVQLAEGKNKTLMFVITMS
jgi:hypothetical protein